MDGPPSILEVFEIEISSRGKAILQRVSLQIFPGEIVGLLGPNGSGKSTLFHTVMGILRPKKGKIFLEGNEITHLPLHRRAYLGMGYLCQEPSVLASLSVEDNLLAILELLPYSREERYAILEERLRELDLHKVRKSRAGKLSGGERRRLEITRTLLKKRSLLLLDEPFANIDPLSIEEVKELMQRLKREGLAIFITDHNARELLSLVDRCYLLFQGKILYSGTPEEMMENGTVKRLYLGEAFAM